MILFGYGAAHAVQIDSTLIPYGRRLRDLDIGEYLSYVYGWCVERMTSGARTKFDYELTPDEVIAEQFDWLPEGLKGQRPPAGWVAAGRQNH